MAEGAKNLIEAFPKLKTGWFNQMNKAVKEESWSTERFRDAVKYLVRNWNNTFIEPRIADFLNYDKVEEYFTYNQLLKLVDGGEIWDSFEFVEENKWRRK